jgi:alkylation response protein AidB-like acyl-CoA dehydrogenase
MGAVLARLSEEQALLRDAARAVLARECPTRLVRERLEAPGPPGDALWHRLAGLGWPGLAVPAEYGGAGLGFVELALVLEEAGRALLPEPLFSTAVLGAGALLLAGSEAQRRRWLPEIAAGRCRMALALLEEDGRWGAEGIALVARRDAEGRAASAAGAGSGALRLTGGKRFVLDAERADLLVVAARSGGHGEDGVSLALVDARAPGLTLRPTAFVDLTRRVAELRFEDVAVPAEHVLGAEGAAWPALSRLLGAARAGLAAESLGVAERVLELSLAHARSREQFGRPIGSFQAVQQRCADMLVRVEMARSAVWRAAWCLAEEDPAEAHLAACMAKAYAGEACREVAAAGIQVHGGLGVTWEQDLHLHYKRAQANELLFGDGPFCRELVAEALLSRSPAR